MGELNYTKRLNTELDSSVFTELMDIQTNLMNQFVKKIEATKEEIVLKTIKNLGFEIDIEEEKNKRFSDIKCEFVGKEERYFYNDGSDNGVRLVTFYSVTDCSPIEINSGFGTRFTIMCYYGDNTRPEFNVMEL